MSKYLVTLKPVDKFFFGGDMTFEVAGKGEHNKKFKSYIIESAKFPQQTSLLGMMRFLLLRKSPYFENGKITDKDGAAGLIGEHSFEVNNADGFGKIRSLSGCFIRDRRAAIDYAFAPYTHAFSLNTVDAVGVVNGIKISIPELDGYQAKDGYEKYLIAQNSAPVKVDDVFVKDRRIGINRDVTTGLTEDSALFKQISYRFNDKDADYCFAFYVEVDDVDLVTSEFNGEVVSIGADNSQFIINFEKDCTDNRPGVAPENAVVIQSPAYLTRETLRLSSFFMTETMPFRFLETTVKGTDNYSVYSNTLTRSKKYELYTPGSIFFFSSEDKMNSFISKLENKDGENVKNEFARIGFNEYSK